MSEIATRPAGAALVPTNMREAIDFANMMARAGFLAKELQNPGGALFVIEQAIRWNMSPFSVAMETSFIQGKPMFSGKIVAAAVVSSGVVAGRLAYEYSGAGEDRAVRVSATICGEAQPREVSVRLREAKTANKVWQTQPDQQLAYHGARVWARRHAPEVMLGVYAPEEMDEAASSPRDVPNLAAEPRPAPQPAPDTLPILAPSGDLKEMPAARWLAGVAKAVATLEDTAAVRGWRDAMVAHVAVVEARDPIMAAEADRIIAERFAELGAERGEAPEGDA